MNTNSMRAGTFALLGLAACTSLRQPELSTGFHARADRMSDEIVAADQSRFDSLLTAAAGDARATAYLRLAREAYERNEADSIVAKLVVAGRGGESLPVLTNAPLWAALDSARRNSATAADAVALEEALIRAQYQTLGAPNCGVWAKEAAERVAALRPHFAPSMVVAQRTAVRPPTAPPPATEPPTRPAPPPAVVVNDPPVLAGIPTMVHFALDKHYLAPTSQRVLQAVLDSIRKFPDVQIRIEGHTDPRASVSYNDALSRRRATSVRKYLLAAGVSASRLTIVARGELQLETAQRDITSMARNRRVQLRYFTRDGREIAPTAVLMRDLQLERVSRHRR